MQPKFYCPKCQEHVSVKVENDVSQSVVLTTGNPVRTTPLLVSYIYCTNNDCNTIVGTIAVPER